MPKTGKRIRVGISIGDVNGIGPEVIIKTFQDNRILKGITPIIYGSSRLFKFLVKHFNSGEFHFNAISKADDAHAKKINVVEVWDEELMVKFGSDTKKGGEYAFKSLKAAVEDLASNKFDVLITAPINKKNIQSKEFSFPGHTEYLASYANEENPLMIMVHDSLRVGVITGHIPLSQVAATITPELIGNKIEAMHKTLSHDFGIVKPKIAVLGINPHSGDNGLIGEEEQKVVIPALEKAKENGYLAFGPYPADGFFASSGYTQFDGVLAMYHDQGLIPFKTLSHSDGVNFTAGLPIVRTSPDHGTAFDIAGKGIASPISFRNALFTACDIYQQRINHREMTANPLPKRKK